MSNERWTYQVLEIMPTFFRGRVAADRLQDELNRAGAQGWELVAVSHTGGRAIGAIQLILKRVQ